MPPLVRPARNLARHVWLGILAHPPLDHSTEPTVTSPIATASRAVRPRAGRPTALLLTCVPPGSEPYQGRRNPFAVRFRRCCPRVRLRRCAGWSDDETCTGHVPATRSAARLGSRTWFSSPAGDDLRLPLVPPLRRGNDARHLTAGSRPWPPPRRASWAEGRHSADEARARPPARLPPGNGSRPCRRAPFLRRR